MAVDEGVLRTLLLEFRAGVSQTLLLLHCSTVTWILVILQLLSRGYHSERRFHISYINSQRVYKVAEDIEATLHDTIRRVALVHLLLHVNLTVRFESTALETHCGLFLDCEV